MRNSHSKTYKKKQHGGFVPPPMKKPQNKTLRTKSNKSKSKSKSNKSKSKSKSK